MLQIECRALARLPLVACLRFMFVCDTFGPTMRFLVVAFVNRDVIQLAFLYEPFQASRGVFLRGMFPAAV